MGFSAQVQSPQSNQSSGKGGPSNQSSQSGAVDPGFGYTPGQGQNMQAQQPFQSGKGSAPMQGQQGQVTYPSTSGQQQMGSPNPYPNTIGRWDNASIQPNRQSGGKGKGG